jgi:maltose-binding protein MalE
MFLSGRVSYYVAGPDDLRTFAQSLGDETIEVAPLPSGPKGPSGPLLPVEAVMLSTISSAEQATTAEAVAEYLTNPQQSTIFMRELGRIPANRLVEVDPRVYPMLAGFGQQSQTAVSLPNELDREAFYRHGDRAYANAISGVLTPEEAVCEFGLAVIEVQGYTDDQVDLPEGCVADAVGDEEVDR